MFWFLESNEDPPPLPARSAVFVMRNGRYEPQNLMPVLPRMDVMEFDGFVSRRGGSAGHLTARPPDMRQASLVKNPVSVRRDSVRVRCDAAGRGVCLDMVFDAKLPCTITVQLLVSELEESSDQCGERRMSLLAQSLEGAEDNQVASAPVWAGQLGAVLDRRRCEAGLGQSYESPPMDLSLLPAEMLAFDRSRPADVPLAVCLEPDSEDVGGQACVHYSYISLQKAVSGSDQEVDGDSAAAQWLTQVFAQKLQYGGNCFVLHEVFGVASKRAADNDAESGNSECVICLTEPRDTAVLPCRHMCFCKHCAGIVRLQCDRCPVCRQKVKSLLQFKNERDVKTEQLMGLLPEEVAGQKSLQQEESVMASKSSSLH